MKRLLTWLVIAVAPTSVWLAVTETGRAAWRSFVAVESRATATVVPVDLPSTSVDGSRAPRNIMLVPARPAPTEPALRVQVGGRRTVGQEHSRLSVGLVVTDPQGRRTGIDTFKDVTHREIADSKVERSVSRDRNGNEIGAVVIAISPAASTIYTLEVTGNPGGEYSLAVAGVSPTLQSVTSILQGRALLNTSVHYQVDLTKIRSLPFPGRGGMVASVVDPREEFVSQAETRVRVSSYDTLPSICERVYAKLSNAKGGKLERASEFTLGGRRYDGCRVSLSGHKQAVTGDPSPGFLYPQEGSEMYYRGWKADSEADGPNGTSYRIQNPAVFCEVSGSWDGGVDDDPAYTRSDRFDLTVVCAARPENFR